MNNRTYQRILSQFRNPDIIFAYVDLFCGAGGTSTGVNNSNYGRVVACVNHDKTAIASHAANHPNAMHFVEDIRTINLMPIVRLINDIRTQYPKVKIVLWASLECTNFSKAKGGMPRDADSRTLAEHLYRYIEILSPDYIQIENVVEFMSWGPLDENGKPESRKNGKDWMNWCKYINQFGYRDDWKEINAADFGARTSRNRLFGVFAKGDLPIVWPLPTHSKKPSINGMFGDLKKWMPVRPCLDFTDVGESIFNRKKPLVEKTLERIYAGLVKFVAKGDDSFIQKHFSGKPMGKVVSTNGPSGTITTTANQSLITVESAVFLAKYNSTDKNTGKVSAGISIEEPCHTLAVQQRIAIVSPEFLVKFNHNEACVSMESPSPTLTTKDKMALILMKYHGTGENLIDPDGPSSTITTKDRIAVAFLDQQYGQSKPAGLEQPAGTLTGNPKLAIAFIETNFTSQFLMPTQFDNAGRSLEDPSPVITASRKHHYLVSAESGENTIIIYTDDSLIMQKIKIFMAYYGIVDIRMRMLKVRELLAIQGFPPTYILKGTQTEQKKHIGNSVHPFVPVAMINALAVSFLQQRAA